MSRDAITILLAEDDDGHAVLVERNLRRAGVSNRIERMRDGQDALDYLNARGPHLGRQPGGPLLMLLDISLFLSIVTVPDEMALRGGGLPA